MAAELDIDIVVAAAPRPAVVLGDPAQLDRVLVNLVSNAVKYSPPGSTVELAVGGDDQHVEVVCADHGLGISPDDQDHLFGEFFRSDDPGVRAVSGTGLGLAIVQRVVSQHQGRIELDSELGIGSTFRVLLPRAGG